MSFLFFDVIGDGFGANLFGNDLLLALAVFAMINLLFFRARIPAFLVVVLNVPLVSSYAITKPVFPTYVYGVVIMAAAVVLALMLLRFMKE